MIEILDTTKGAKKENR
jgi:hypothetical protein